jgi:hypothetical protein
MYATITKLEVQNNYILGMSSSGQLKTTRIILNNATGILKYFLIGTTQRMPLLQIAQALFAIN